jgi:hypothetical protein
MAGLEFKEEHLTAIIETRGYVENLEKAVARIEAGVTEQLENGHACMDDHEDRILKLEDKRRVEAAVVSWREVFLSKVFAGAVVLATVIMAVLDHLGDIIQLLRRIFLV